MAAMVESLAGCLTRQGHRISVAGMGAEPHVGDTPLGVYSGGLKNRSMIIRGAFELAGSLRLASLLRGCIRKGRLPVPQLVVVFLPSLFLALTSGLLKRLYGCQVFLVQRDLLPDWLIQSGRLRPGVASWLLGRLKVLALADADQVGIECEENRRFIPTRFQSKVEVVVNWRDYSPAQTYLNPLPEEFTLVYGGRIGFAQGFDRFLDALITAKLPDVRFQIYCDERGASELTAMRKEFSHQVAGIAVHSMLPEAMFLAKASMCSMGVVSLSPEMGTHNIPGKLLGYLAAGIPVFAIGPDGCALGRLVEDLGIGIFADANQKGTIAAKLTRVASDRKLVSKLKENALTARPKFSVENAAAQIQSFVQV